MANLPEQYRGISRRGFLAATAAAGIASGAVPALCALAADDGAASAPVEQYFTNSCRSNCGGKCSLRVTVREGRVVKTEPVHYNPGDEDLERICIKGLAQPQRLYDPDRLKYPMKRVDGTERGAGEWEKISWDEAFDLMAEAFKKARSAAGNTGLAMWTGYGSCGFLNGSNSHGAWSVGYGRFSQGFGTASFDSAADWAGVYGALLTGVYSQGCTDDVVGSKAVILWGAEITEAMQGEWISLKRALEQGTKLICIDPRFSVTASKADVWLPIRPGTDGALVLAYCNYVIEHDLIDYNYLTKASVAPFLVKPDGTFLRMSDFGVEPIDQFDMTTYTMVKFDPCVVWDPAAGAYAAQDTVEMPAVFGEYEIEGIAYKTALQISADAIKPYTMEFAARECNLNLVDMERVIRMYAEDKPASFITYNGAAHHGNSHHFHKGLALLVSLTGNHGRRGAVCLDGGSWRGYTAEDQSPATPPNPLPVIKFPGMLFPRAMRDGKIGDTPVSPCAVWFVNGNPLAMESGRAELVEAVKKLDFAVYSDSVMTDTARMCDVVLPIVHPFEGYDIEDGVSCTTGYMHPLAKCVEPAFDCRSDMDCYRAIATRMGMPELFDKTDEEYLRTMIDSYADNMLGVTYDGVMDAANRGEAVRCPVYMGFSDEQSYSTATSATKKVEFYFENPWPRYLTGQTLDMEKERVPYYEHADEAYVDNPDVASGKYPLFAINQHSRFSAHSQQAHTPLIRELQPEPTVKMNPKDARSRNIAQGDVVRMFNDRGHVIIKAEVSEGVAPGTILLRQGWQSDHFIEGHIQDLTSIRMNEFCFNSSFNDFICQVEKAN